MKRENLLIQKTKLRLFFKEKRKSLSSKRRKQAAEKAFSILKNRGIIASFSSIGSEIDLSLLNQFLKENQRLLLIPHKPPFSRRLDLEKVDCILVPGLCFDGSNYRIGYGKGYYDQLLARFPNLLSIGIGFEEQFYPEELPKESWDIPVKELLLF